MTASPDVNQLPGRGEPSGSHALPRRLYRSRTNRTFAGVCGGIAEYYGADPSAVRLLTIVIALFTAVVPMFVLYLVAAIVIPERIDGDVPTGARSGPVAVAPGQGGLVLGMLLVVVGVVALGNQMFRIDWDMLWPVALIIGGVAVVFAAQRR